MTARIEAETSKYCKLLMMMLHDGVVNKYID
jgi:hypothetical protein